MPRPLDGINVVALAQAVAAPFATRQLADLGARVIKIERPGVGDFPAATTPQSMGSPATSADSTAGCGTTAKVVRLFEDAGIASARLRTPEQLTRHPQ